MSLRGVLVKYNGIETIAQSNPLVVVGIASS